MFCRSYFDELRVGELATVNIIRSIYCLFALSCLLYLTDMLLVLRVDGGISNVILVS